MKPRLLTADTKDNYSTRVTLLGTAGGPPWWDGTDRTGISTVISVNDTHYIVDLGEGWGPQFRKSGLGPAGFQKGLDGVRAVFITHHHSDHIVDLPNLLLLAWHNGSDGLKQPIEIYGPGNRGELPPIFAADQRDVQPEVFNPDSPTPGLRESADKLMQAFALDINDRMRDNAKQDLSEVFAFYDIELPGTTGSQPNQNPSPEMEPFEVYRDENVVVSAILVDHRPIFPAFAFRFDTVDGAIVVSGDTGVCHNLVKISEGADMLLHECIDMDWVDSLMGPNSPKPDPNLMQHMLAAHTSIEEVGRQAQAADVDTLVLTHLVPGNTPVEKWQQAAQDFDGDFYVGEDLMQFGIGTPTRGDRGLSHINEQRKEQLRV